AEEQRRAQAAPVRKDGEDTGPNEPVERPPAVVALDMVARLLDQTVVLNSGRAGGDARHTAEATVEVLHHRLAQRNRPVDEPLHQIDPPARRIHLLVPEGVRRARRQTEAAVDAVGDQLGLHIASRTRSASGLHTGSRACSTYAKRGPGRTRPAACASHRTRPGSRACNARSSSHGSAASPPSARSCASTARAEPSKSTCIRQSEMSTALGASCDWCCAGTSAS